MNRLKEPSTWAGLATIAQMLAAFLPAPYSMAMHAITAAAGAAAVSLRESHGS